MMTSAFDRIAAFKALHASGCFVMPNPWDAGTARALEGLGFPAVATTSSGFAWTSGRPDNRITLEDALTHMRLIAANVTVPVNADFEGGFAVSPEDVASNVARAVSTGVAGLSIEDSTGNPSDPLFAFTLAVDRIRAARQAIDRSGTGVILTGRSEGFIVGRPDLGETIRRLTAYAEAGADCLYAPGLRELKDIAAIVRAVSPRPVNVLASSAFSVADLSAAGVRRISIGSGLARLAWAAWLEGAREMTQGSFASLGRAAPFADINALFDSD